MASRTSVEMGDMGVVTCRVLPSGPQGTGCPVGEAGGSSSHPKVVVQKNEF